MNRYKISAVGMLAFRIGGVAVGFLAALLYAFRQVFAAGEAESDGGRQLHDSDLSGQLNHRTGRLDSGTDPYGWYDRD
jgi:tetrahydromethanopterin S-methyltransferase subunit F